VKTQQAGGMFVEAAIVIVIAMSFTLYVVSHPYLPLFTSDQPMIDRQAVRSVATNYMSAINFDMNYGAVSFLPGAAQVQAHNDLDGLGYVGDGPAGDQNLCFHGAIFQRTGISCLNCVGLPTLGPIVYDASCLEPIGPWPAGCTTAVLDLIGNNFCECQFRVICRYHTASPNPDFTAILVEQ